MDDQEEYIAISIVADQNKFQFGTINGTQEMRATPSGCNNLIWPAIEEEDPN